MIYVDTSVWVALMTPETGTAQVETWFRSNAEPLVSADWTLTEFHSAIAIKTRTGQVSPDQAGEVLALFERLTTGGLTLIPISRVAYRAAAELVDDYRQGLRGADALHLAVAQELGLQRFATLDRNQSLNARRLGLTLELPLLQGL
ncbi:MAG: type II toxin-antitoxin system VapC family toxin [Chromatiaceae bacterium]